MILWFNWFSLPWLEGHPQVFRRSRRSRYRADTEHHLFNKKKTTTRPKFINK